MSKRATRGLTHLVLLPCLFVVVGCSEGPLGSTEPGASSSAALNASPKLNDFVIYAQNSATLRDRVAVTGGDVGVKNVATGPTLVSGYELALVNDSTVDTTQDVLSNRLLLQNRARVGDVEAKTLTNQGGFYSQRYAFPTMPALPALALVAPGSTSISVPIGGSKALGAGRYAAVTVGARGTLRLGGGLYELSSLKVDDDARVEALAPSELRIAGRLTTLSRFRIGPTAVGLLAKDLRIEVSGKNGSSGSLSEWPKAATLANDGVLTGLVLVPNGTLQVGQRASVTGSVMARDVYLDIEARAAFQSGFNPPTCDPLACDDANSCTTDTCTNGACAHTPVAVGTSCADANACNGDEVCSATGTCLVGTPPALDDGNSCTEDSCDPITGVSHAPLAAGTPCADANACNGSETCDGAGACQPGTAPPLDDGNPCTTDGCDSASGVTHVPAPAGTPCSDGDACNGEEVCGASGTCAAGTPPALDDGNPCTSDACDATGGITHLPLAAGAPCSDGNACNGVEACDGAGTCAGGAAPVPDDGNPCTADSCDPLIGVLHAPLPAGTSCADADHCNGEEACDAAGTCVASTPSEIDDGNPCTIDSCDPATGVLHTPLPAGSSCSNGDACDGSETCTAGAVCQPGTAPVVDDGNPCTVDSCDPVHGVVHQPTAAGVSCSDGDACNGAEVCDGLGSCGPGTPPVLDDGNPCTIDACSPAAGVTHEPAPMGAPCNDQDACNGAETCEGAGTCQGGVPLEIDDGNPCTADACDANAGLVHTPLATGTSCSNGNACDGAELCDGSGTCHTGTPPPLDDGNPCTVDYCDPDTGVQHVPATAGTACADANACNGDEVCDGAGACTAGVAPELDDGNPCTNDYCDPAAGVIHAPANPGSSCSDGNPCNGDETCDASATCTAGTPPVLDDGNPCTVDGCDASQGVTHLPASTGTPCSDGNACNGSENCDASGACVPGQAPAMDDGNPCTVDSCDPAQGVVHSPATPGTACSEGNSCEAVSTCDSAGACVPGTQPVVDDSNPCTVDACDPATGVVTHQPAPVGTECNSCGETCDGAGQCVRTGPCGGAVATNVHDSMAWLYTGANPVQVGVAPGTITLQRGALISGRVLDVSGFPLAGVTVRTPQHSEFGYTVSAADGAFHMVVNGGESTLLSYEHEGFLPVQRKLPIAWGDYVRAPDVAMTQVDAETAIDLTAPGDFQLAQGSVRADDDGERQGTLLFPEGTEANLTLPDGSTYALEQLTVQITEYTVGERGQLAMPAELPRTSSYTYAVELGAREAAAAGATRVEFSQPLVYYVDNFLGFPTGSPVPLGWYDREQGVWVPAESGVVLSIVGIAEGQAGIDVTGDGLADSGPALDEYGITVAELGQMAQLFDVGQSLWRVCISHFTPYDLNWSSRVDPTPSPPACPTCSNGGAGGSGGSGGSGEGDSPEPDSDDDCTKSGGSAIGCLSRTLQEEIPIAGTAYSLQYSSGRVSGGHNSFVDVVVSGPEIHPELRMLEAEVVVAGQVMVRTFAPAPNVTTRFIWDGNDDFGNPVQGSAMAEVRVRHWYWADYEDTPRFGEPGVPLAVPITARFPVPLETKSSVLLRRPMQVAGLSMPLGGWSLNVQHAYDPLATTLFLGDGRKYDGLRRGLRKPAVVGGGTVPQATWRFGSNVPASTIQLGVGNQTGNVRALAVAGDNSVYFFTATNGALYRVDPDGLLSWISGVGMGLLDGPANQAMFNAVNDIEVGSEGRLYVGESYLDGSTTFALLREVEPDGSVRTIAGGGTADPPADGTPALGAKLYQGNWYGTAIAVGNDGSLYATSTKALPMSASQGQLYRIDPAGMLTRVAGGTGASCSAIDGARARDLPLGDMVGVETGPDGRVYFVAACGTVAGSPYYLMELLADGTTRVVAGGGSATPANGLRARDVKFFAYAWDVDESGQVWFFRGRPSYDVYRIDASGVLKYEGSWPPANPTYTGTVYYVLEAAPKGVLYYSGDTVPTLRRAEAAQTLSSEGALSLDAQTSFAFDDRGRHLATVDTATGTVLYQFGYDADGNLERVTTGDGNVTTLERAGNLVTITGPFGQRTVLELDANGYLERVTNPANESVTMVSSATGLLQRFTDARGIASNMTYDSLGRLETDSRGAATMSLSSYGNPIDWHVQFSSAEGRLTRYSLQRQPNGDTDQLTIFPDGTTARALKNKFGTSAVATAGTTTATRYVDDPEFGPSARYTGVVTTTTPAGLVRTVSTARNLTSTGWTEITTTNARQATVTFNKATRTYSATSAGNRTTTRVVDAQGRTAWIQTGTLTPVNFAYDTRGRLSTVTQGTRTTTRTYAGSGDAAGYLETLTNALNQTTTYIPDSVGRTLFETTGTSTTGFTWDPDSNLTSVTPPGKPEHEQAYTPANLLDRYTPPSAGLAAPSTYYAYDLDRNLRFVTQPGGIGIERQYDSAGRLALLTMPTGAVDYAYYPPGCGTPGCAPGKIASITGPGNTALSLGYDGMLTTGVAWSGDIAGSLSWGYDADFRINAETVTDGTGASQTMRFGYDADSLLTCASPTSCTLAGADALRLTYNTNMPLLTGTTLGSTTDSYTYNSFGELASYTARHGTTMLYSEVTHSTATPRDALGRIVEKAETANGTLTTHRYAYDLQGRLTEVRRNGTQVEQYTYDANGNRLSLTTPDGTTTGTYDDQDRLLTYGKWTYAYADNGELRTKTDTETGAVTTYTYDALGNLLAVALPDGRLVEYAVDGRGRRVARRLDGLVTNRWLYKDQLNPVAELDADGNLLARYVYGSKANVPDMVVRYDGGTTRTYRVISDHLGSPGMAVNAADPADVPFTAEYTSFGEVSGTGLGWMAFGFAGGRYDAETGLIRFGARDYDAVVGRWTSKDPSRWKGGQANLMTYASSDPVNWIDMTGRQTMAPPIPWWLPPAAGAAIGARAGIPGALIGACIGALFITGDSDTVTDISEPPVNDNSKDCYTLYLEQATYCGETYTDDYRYDMCMTSAWNNYIRCLNGLPPLPLVSWY